MKIPLSVIKLLQIIRELSQLVERESSCIPLRVTGLPQRSAPMARTYPTQPAADAAHLGSAADHPLGSVGTDDGYQFWREPLSQIVNARRDAADRVSWCHSPYLSRPPTDLAARRVDLVFASPSTGA